MCSLLQDVLFHHGTCQPSKRHQHREVAINVECLTWPLNVHHLKRCMSLCVCIEIHWTTCSTNVYVCFIITIAISQVLSSSKSNVRTKSKPPAIDECFKVPSLPPRFHPTSHHPISHSFTPAPPHTPHSTSFNPLGTGISLISCPL